MLKSACGPSLARRAAIAKAIEFYKSLPKPFDPIECDVEADFYERLSSSDIRSVLQASFTMLKDLARADYVAKGFDAGAMHSAIGAAALVNRAFEGQNWEQIDQVLGSPAELAADDILVRLLESYPATEQKARNVSTAVARGIDPDRARKALSSYVVSSEDEHACKLAVCDALANAGISMRGSSFATLTTTVSGDIVRSYADVMARVPQSDEDMAVVVDAALCHLSCDDAAYVLQSFSKVGNFLQFSQKSVLGMLSRQDFTVADKDAGLSLCESLGMDERRIQSVLGSILQTRLDAVCKMSAVASLVRHAAFVNPRRFEDYLLNWTADGKAKPAIAEQRRKMV